jgi:hypothetical protein
MAKLSKLVLRTSQVTGIPEATVREISRRLREARRLNLIGTGKGGRYGGADMTPNDAASLLTALLILRALSVSLTKIGQLTDAYLRGLRAYSPANRRMILGRWDRRLKLPGLCRLEPGHTFGEALSTLISSIAEGDMERAASKWGYFELQVVVDRCRPDYYARIEFETSKLGPIRLHYIRASDARKTYVENKARRWSDVPEDTASDLNVSAAIGDPTLKSIGVLLKNSEAKHD